MYKVIYCVIVALFINNCHFYSLVFLLVLVVQQVPLGHGDRVDPDEGGDNIYNTM